jgi:hypothetical protein
LAAESEVHWPARLEELINRALIEALEPEDHIDDVRSTPTNYEVQKRLLIYLFNSSLLFCVPSTLTCLQLFTQAQKIPVCEFSP